MQNQNVSPAANSPILQQLTVGALTENAGKLFSGLGGMLGIKIDKPLAQNGGAASVEAIIEEKAPDKPLAQNGGAASVEAIIEEKAPRVAVGWYKKTYPRLALSEDEADVKEIVLTREHVIAIEPIKLSLRYRLPVEACLPDDKALETRFWQAVLKKEWSKLLEYVCSEKIFFDENKTIQTLEETYDAAYKKHQGKDLFDIISPSWYDHTFLPLSEPGAFPSSLPERFLDFIACYGFKDKAHLMRAKLNEEEKPVAETVEIKVQTPVKRSENDEIIYELVRCAIYARNRVLNSIPCLQNGEGHTALWHALQVKPAESVAIPAENPSQPAAVLSSSTERLQNLFSEKRDTPGLADSAGIPAESVAYKAATEFTRRLCELIRQNYGDNVLDNYLEQTQRACPNLDLSSAILGEFPVELAPISAFDCETVRNEIFETLATTGLDASPRIADLSSVVADEDSLSSPQGVLKKEWQRLRRKNLLLNESVLTENPLSLPINPPFSVLPRHMAAAVQPDESKPTILDGEAELECAHVDAAVDACADEKFTLSARDDSQSNFSSVNRSTASPTRRQRLENKATELADKQRALQAYVAALSKCIENIITILSDYQRVCGKWSMGQADGERAREKQQIIGRWLDSVTKCLAKLDSLDCASDPAFTPATEEQFNAVLGRLIEKQSKAKGALGEIQEIFREKNPHTGSAYWDIIQQKRSGSLNKWSCGLFYNPRHNNGRACIEKIDACLNAFKQAHSPYILPGVVSASSRREFRLA